MSAPGNVRRRREGARDDWETPQDVFERLDLEFRFTLDPAANEHNRKTERWLEGPCRLDMSVREVARENPALIERAKATLKEDFRRGVEELAHCGCGLCADWLDHTVFLNPPYSAVEKWLDKAAAASRRGAVSVALVPNATETDWFRQHVLLSASECRFVFPRVQFVHPPGCGCKACEDGKRGANTTGSVLAIYRPDLGNYGGPRFTQWTWR